MTTAAIAHAYCVMWPIVDDTIPVADLQAEALPDLYTQLQERHLQPIGQPAFGLVSDDPLSPTGLTLTARIEVAA